MGEEIGDYYLGLDIGTSSVGWAVTDPEYNILNYRRKALWGIISLKKVKLQRNVVNIDAPVAD